MAEAQDAVRSRRALLVAAAGTTAALVASAAMPLAASAHDPDDIEAGADNATTATTSISDSTVDSTAFEASATGTGFGVQGTSTGGAGVFAWSISAPPSFDPSLGAYTGTYGWAPAGPDAETFGVGVWGDSDDWGVFGTGGVGVYGYGDVGVYGESSGPSAGVVALGASASSLALDVRGKVKFSRAGRATVAKHKSSIKVTLAGVNSASRIFAVVSSNRASRWVRAAVPATGSFTVYLNASVSAATYVSWFVLD